MNKPNYSVFRLTRVLTMLCMIVVLSVGIYSTFLAVRQTFYKYAVSSNIQNLSPTIIIDAGHGGEDGGTQSASGILEKDINLSISLTLRDIFDFFGFNTVMTRETDRLIYDPGNEGIKNKKVSDIHNRLAITKKYTGSILISIHQNYFTQSKYNGAQTFYSVNNPESEKLALSIQKSIVSLMQPENQREIKPTGDEIYLLYHAENTAVMVECGFLSNPEEAEKLNDDSYRKEMALAVFAGTYKYYCKR